MNRKLFVVMQVVVLALVGSAIGTAAGRFNSLPGPAQHSLGMASNASPLTPVGSGFTYQGRLLDGGNPANGSYDFQIILYDTLVGGNQVGPIITATNQLVSDGLTTLTLDFGVGAFDGNGRWLEVQVRPAGGGGYTILTPRQAVTAAPYAMRAGSVADGSITNASISPNSSIELASNMARQAIINGNFDVWQRGSSFTPADVSAIFNADHWADYIDKDGGTLPTLTRSRQTLTPEDIPNAFYYTRLNTSGAGSGFGTGSYGSLSQKIENGTRLLAGQGKKVTVSFWARSSISNKRLGILMYQSYGIGTPTIRESINGTNWTLTSAWTKYTYTFTTNTLVGKTFGTGNDDYLEIDFLYLWGSLHQNEVGASSPETFVGSGNIDIAQVQLCAGEVALPFQPKSFEQELAASQRYYEKSYNYTDAPGTSTPGYINNISAASIGASGRSTMVLYKVKKRATPTITLYSPGGTSGQAQWDDLGIGSETRPTSASGINEIGFYVDTNSLTASRNAVWLNWTADAELP